MSELLNPLLQWLNANPEWAGAITFIVSAAESVAVVGTIVPGTIMMTAIGTLAGAGVIPLWYTIMWAILGAIIGDGISYWAGYYYKDRLHTIWPFRKHPGMLASGEIFFKKHGGTSVFIGRFVGPVRALVPVVAGMFGVTPLRFTIANILSAIGWAPIYMLPGIVLGAASLELPPDMATQMVVSLLLFALLIILCFWLFKKLLSQINQQINQFLTWIWNGLKKSRYFHMFTWVLKHHEGSRFPTQLILLFYFLLFLGFFSTLAAYIKCVNSPSIFINTVFFHFFRSMHTPTLDNAAAAVTLIGEQKVVLAVAVGLFGWLAYTKRWYTALHVLALTLLTDISVDLIKHWVHSPRPWGIVHSPDGFSFPSGHSTLSSVLVFGLTLLLIHSWQLKRKWPLLMLATLIVALVGLSRIYLDAHWVTDVVGGWLLSITLLILITLSYNRKKEKLSLIGGQLFTVVTVFFIIAYSFTFHRDYQKLLADSTQLNWPIYTIAENSWWQFVDEHKPVYRLNRFGLEQQILNIQWLGSIDDIHQTLLRNDWQDPPEQNWVTVLQRVADVKSFEHLPLVSPLYLDKKPVLVLVKHANNEKRLIVLRLWQSDLQLANISQPLWVGAVELIPRTFSWLFKKRNAQKMSLTADLLFNQVPPNLDIKQIHFNTNKDNETSIILVKPKGASHHA